MNELWLFKTADCRPCVAYQPQVAALAARLKVSLEVIYADDPANERKVARCAVGSVPSVALVCNGSPVYLVAGPNLKQLEWACEAHFGRPA